MIYSAIEEIIGNTPLLRIDASRYGIEHTDIFVKLEYLNPFGSIKDRTANALLESVETSGVEHVIESSSGNTAKALQLLGKRQGLNLTSVTNRIKIPEVEQFLRYIQTDIVALPGRSECPDPNDADNALNTIDRLCRENPGKYVHTSQYSNRANTHIHATTTAQELYEDLPHIDTIVTGVGTGGSSGGLIEFAQKYDKSTKHIGVVANPSDFLPGIRTKNELFETELFGAEQFDELREVTSLEALEALQKLVIQEGVLAGPTTGANFAALLAYLQQHDTLRDDGQKNIAVFIACDRLESYMSYIMKRQPELFGATLHSDVYTATIVDEETDDLTVSPDDGVQDWIAASGILVVDTRGAKPYGNFRIPGSINYPEELLKEVLETGMPFANQKVLFVCPTGDRSLYLAKTLRGRGVESYSLAGGLVAWRTARLPLERRA